MKFGIRKPSLKKRIAARTSLKRFVRHSMGLKAPRGLGIFTNPKKALYNRVYNKTTVSVDRLFMVPGSIKGGTNSSVKGNMNEFKPGVQIENTGSLIRSSSKALTVTSKNFEELRQQITETYNQRIELNKKLNSARLKLYALSLLHFASFILIIGFFYKKIAEDKDTQQQLVKDLQSKLTETYVKLTFADKSQLEKSWLNLVDAFAELMQGEKIWKVTYTEDVNKLKARTIAQTASKRELIPQDKEKQIEFIQSDLQPLYLPNTNGPDLFFFPTFLLLYRGNQQFGIFDLKEVNASLKLSGYIEEEGVPGDTEVIQQTWKKANKDGSMDKRFKGNYQIPIVKYGTLLITSNSGLEESFMFSNFNAFTDFSKSYEFHLGLLKKL